MSKHNKRQIAPKRIKFQKMWRMEEDGISALPDCLLLEILSRLPSTKDAIRTGTLSIRWKHLRTSVPSLYFNNYTDWRSYFFSSVDKTLTQRRQLKLKKFEVNTSYDIQYESQVNHWIRYAINCNVEELNLTLDCTDFGVALLVDQNFFVSSCFTKLTLEGCVFNPIGAISWKNLRSLCISYGIIDEDLIENILHGSPLLETLKLDNCYGYRRLDITSKSIKKLVFSGYMDPDDNIEADIIEINAPNIRSLTIQDELLLWKLLLLNVSSLVEANLNYAKMGFWETTLKEEEEEMLKGFILKLGHVKELKIGDLCSEVVSRLESQGFVFPSNIKFHDVTSNLYSHRNSRDIEKCSCLTIVLKVMRLIN